MSVSTDAKIFYGIAFEYGYEFPWHDDYIEEWWIYGANGFKHSLELYDTEGNYLNGRKPSREEISRYYGERKSFSKSYPIPVELINYCSSDYPMYALAVPGTVITAKRGYPEVIDTSSLVVDNEKVDAMLKFCNDQGIELERNLSWILASYYG